MAELNVERKKHSAWPWIVGLLVVLLALWAFSQVNDGNDAAATAQTSTDTTIAPATTDATVAADTTADDSTITTGEAPRDDTATTGEAPADGYAP